VLAIVLGAAAVAAGPRAARAQQWIFRPITLPQGSLGVDFGFAIGHRGDPDPRTGPGVNLEIAYGISSDFELALRTGIRFGTLVLVLAEVNRAVGEYRIRLERVLFFSFVFLLAMTVGIMQEDTFRIFMHGAKFYLVVMMVAPIWVAAVARASENRWAATIVTGSYSLMHIAFMWILQLVPAEPKLGPVYQKITHLVPPDFPLLLIVPAIVFDIVRRHISTLNRWAQAAILGAASLASFLAVQWPFANFLVSPASRNWFFATDNLPYFVPPASHWARNAWLPTESSPTQFALRMLLALAAGILMTRLGFSWGNWMRRLRR